VRWYTAAALVLAVFLLTAGSHFFSAHQQGAGNVSWRLPWFAASIAATLTFQLDPILSFMEGCGFCAQRGPAQIGPGDDRKLARLAGDGSASWAVRPAMIITGNAGVASFWLFRRRELLLPLMRHRSGEHRIHWMKEVWPFQWRIAVSWLSGYFIFQLYNPVLFAYRGRDRRRPDGDVS